MTKETKETLRQENDALRARIRVLEKDRSFFKDEAERASETVAMRSDQLAEEKVRRDALIMLSQTALKAQMDILTMQVTPRKLPF